MKKTIALIGNPVAGRGAVSKIKRAAAILENKGFDVRLMLTGKRGDAETFAGRAVNSELKTRNSELLVIAAGGDGTYNEVANGLVHSDIPMAILPLGTTSVLARELNVPEGLERAVDVAVNGRILTVHLGRITLPPHPGGITRYFLLMAGIGFDGETVFGVSEGGKRFAGKGAYIWGGFKALLGYNPGRIIIKDVSGSFECYAAIVGNGACYGGNFKITPDARLTDPCFYAFLTHGNGRFDLLKYVSGVLRGTHLKFRDISYFRTMGLEVQGKAHIQIDGDYLGTAPARIELVQSALRVVSGN